MTTATASATAPEFPPGDCYKYQWARFVARKTLQDDLESVQKLMAELKPGNNAGAEIPGPDVPLPEKASIGLHQLTRNATGGGIIPPRQESFEVGIVGAGVAGLFTGLLFDWINSLPQLQGKVHINYDIIEAAGEERVGGRLFTHKFSEAEHDYYDVGAMRFPENEIMAR